MFIIRRIVRSQHRESTRIGLAVALFFLLANAPSLNAQVLGQLANSNPRNYDNAKILGVMRSRQAGVLAAHRGTHALAGTDQAPNVPENSLQAIGMAAQAGWEAIEIDVKLTSDRIPILSHDSTWGREWCGRGALVAIPFDPLTGQPSSLNPGVANTSLSDTRSFFGHTVLRDSVSAVNGTTYLGCSAGVSYFGEYPPTLQDVYDYIRNNHIQMVVELDIKDADTAGVAWEVVQEKNDDRGRPASDWTVFKVPAIAFPDTDTYVNTFGANYPNVKFNPVFHTANIAASSFGSEDAMIEWVDTFQNYNFSAPIDIVAIEVSMKEPGDTVDGGILEEVRNSVVGKGITVSQFHSVPEYYVNNDPNQGEYFRSNNGECCYLQQEYLYNNANNQGPFGKPYDHADHRNEMAFLVNDNSARMITTDTPGAFETYLQSVGLRDTSLFQADGSTPPILNSAPPAPITLVAPSSPVQTGRTIQLAAFVYPANAAGQLTLLDSGTIVATAGISNGSATFTVSSISSGSHSYTAEYGDPSSNSTLSSSAVIVTATSSGGTGGGTGTSGTSENLRLMPLGDSITYGYLSSTLNGYRGPLRDALVNEGFSADFVGENNTGTMYDNYNEGFPGYRIDNVDSFVARPVGNYLPNVVTLMLGTNDMNQSWDLANAPTRLGKIIDDVLVADPGATVLVANLIPSSTPLVESNIQAFNPQIPGVIAARASQGRHVALVDMSAVTVADLADNLHPSDEGYQKLANAWNAAILNAANQGWISAPIDCSQTPAGCSSTVLTAGTEPAGEDPNPNRPNTGWPAAPPITPVPIARPGTPAKQPQPAAAANGWGAPVLIAGGGDVGADIHFIDMNNDRKADYLIEVPSTGGFWGFLNNNVAVLGPSASNCSAGSSAPGATQTSCTTGWNGPMEWAGGASPTGVLADINGDGLPDYLVVDPTSGAVTAYLNNGADAAGAGGWRPEGQIAGGQGPGANVRFADLNGDGYADYVVVDPATGSITVALNNGTDLAAGNGWIQAGTILSVPGATGATVELADLNNDGWADYLVVNQSTGAVQAWLNGGPDASAPGAWKWTSLGTIAAGGGNNGWPIVFADIDGDGMADYVVIAPSNGAAWVWLNQGGSSGTAAASQIPVLTGTGGWVTAGHLTNGLGTNGTVIFGDLNGDGKSDYALLNSSSGTLSALYNQGPGNLGWSWSDANVLQTSGGTSGCNTQLIDINGDGLADIASACGQKGYALMNPGVGSTPWTENDLILDLTQDTAAIGGTFVSYASLTNPGFADPIAIDTSTGAVGYWINMGKQGNPSNSPWIKVQGGYGSEANPTPESIEAYGSTSFNGDTTYVAFADINGDEAMDYLNIDKSSGAVWAWIHDSNNGWVPWGEIATGQATKAGDRVIFADINGDHLADYLVVHADNSVDAWLNNSAGAH